MAETKPQVLDIPTPLPPPAQQHPTQQAQQPTQHLTQQAQELVHLNWSHVKLEFSGKSEEDAEAHLLRTNNWMNAHHFLESIKVQ